jgi:serine/threonine protein kinase
LIDFGSAIIADPTKPRPYYTLFCGTSAYASSEILRKEPYQAAPAEIWTLGILLSFLLTGASPFLSKNDAIDGRIVLSGAGPQVMRLSGPAVHLMRRCLEPDPRMRADIREVRAHVWLCGALGVS